MNTAMHPVSLIIGANGQIGQALTKQLINLHGTANVITSDIHPTKLDLSQQHIIANVCDKDAIAKLIETHHVTHVYLLAAMLSATGEQNPLNAWHLNMQGLLNVLEIIRSSTQKIRLFWPSSIAAFGPESPKMHTPQITTMNPNTAYGISKLSGELWCEYYATQYGVDVRSLRYPGIISYDAPPGGGTTDYVIEMIHAAVNQQAYACFLKAEAPLPMMYIDDAICATLQLMAHEDVQTVKGKAYNLAGDRITPSELAHILTQHFPNFVVTYAPDRRQAIADSWPALLDESAANKDWQWQSKWRQEAWIDRMIKGFQSLNQSN